MQKYQLFATSSILLILANYWFIISSNPSVPRLFDYLAYVFFIFGVYKSFKK